MACDNPLQISKPDINILKYALTHQVLKNPHADGIADARSRANSNSEKLTSFVSRLPPATSGSTTNPTTTPNPLVAVLAPLQQNIVASSTSLDSFENEINTLLKPVNLMSAIGTLQLHESALCGLGLPGVNASDGLGVLNQKGGASVNQMTTAHTQTSGLIEKLNSPAVLSAISNLFSEAQLEELVPSFRNDLDASNQSLSTANSKMNSVRTEGASARSNALDFANRFGVSSFLKNLVQNPNGSFLKSIRDYVVTDDFKDVVAKNPPETAGLTGA